MGSEMCIRDSELDIRAATPEPVEDINDEGSAYEVSMLLQGRAQEVVPQFSSEPSRDFASIVNLLAFNTMSFSEAKYSAAFGAVAGQLLGKRVDKIGLDDFALLPSSTVVGAESGAAIRVVDGHGYVLSPPPRASARARCSHRVRHR